MHHLQSSFLRSLILSVRRKLLLRTLYLPYEINFFMFLLMYIIIYTFLDTLTEILMQISSLHNNSNNNGLQWILSCMKISSIKLLSVQNRDIICVEIISILSLTQEKSSKSIAYTYEKTKLIVKTHV